MHENKARFFLPAGINSDGTLVAYLSDELFNQVGRVMINHKTKKFTRMFYEEEEDGSKED